MNLKSWANQLKDSALQEVARWLANQFPLKRLGRITELKLDSSTQKIVINMDLIGELSPIEMELHYRLIGKDQIEIANAQSSRAWMSELINHIIPAERKRFSVPQTVIKILSRNG